MLEIKLEFGWCYCVGWSIGSDSTTLEEVVVGAMVIELSVVVGVEEKAVLNCIWVGVAKSLEVIVELSLSWIWVTTSLEVKIELVWSWVGFGAAPRLGLSWSLVGVVLLIGVLALVQLRWRW
jgi:hypothetical protein